MCYTCKLRIVRCLQGLTKRAPLNTAVVGTFHIMAFSRVARFGSNVLGKMNTNTAKRFDAMMAVSEPTKFEFAAESFGFSQYCCALPIFVRDICRCKTSEAR